MTNEEKLENFKNFLKTFQNGEYEYVSGVYENRTSNLQVRHKTCGTVYTTTYKHLQEGYRCGNCFGKKVLDNNSYQEVIDKLFPGAYTVLKYTNQKEKILLKHNRCGTEFETRACSIRNAAKKPSHTEPCPFCNNIVRRTTKEDAYKEFKEIFPNCDFEIIGEFKNFQVPTKFKCNLCGKEFEMPLEGMIKNYRRYGRKAFCSNCNDTGIIQSFKKDFEEKLEKVHPGKFEVLSYQNMQSPVELLHKKCGRTFTVQASYIVNKTELDQFDMCPYCRKEGGYKKKGTPRHFSNEKFKEKLESMFPGEYEILSDYHGYSEPMKFRHKLCGYEWKTTPSIFYRSNSRYNSSPCPKCNKKLASTDEDIKKMFEEKFPNSKFEILEIGNETTSITGRSIKIKCLKCGHEFSYGRITTVLYSKDLCPYCEKSRVAKVTSIDYLRSEIERIDPNYELAIEEIPENFSIDKTKIDIRHKTCGGVFKMTLHKFKSGRRCSVCTKSINEERIRDYLEEKEYPFEEQFLPDELRLQKKMYKYDFKVGNILIEYDGELHYKDVYGELDLQKQHDKEKDVWAAENGYHLYRIPFWEQDRLEEHLDNILNNKKPEFLYETFEEYKESLCK